MVATAGVVVSACSRCNVFLERSRAVTAVLVAGVAVPGADSFKWVWTVCPTMSFVFFVSSSTAGMLSVLPLFFVHDSAGVVWVPDVDIATSVVVG